jgi:hypothetical protein
MRSVIVVLQYNNSRDTIRCLESVKELNWQDFEVVVVDNASEIQHFNATRLFVESQERAGERRFKLIINEDNFGYAGGNNVGIKYALENGADYALILNPDTTVSKNLLKGLIRAAEKRKTVGIVGSAVRERNKVVYCGEIEWLKSELSHSQLYPRHRTLNANQYIPGSAMLVKKEVFEKTEGFDEKYFLYFEDADFCVRAQKAGFKLAVVPDVSVRHNPSSSTSALGSALLLRYHYRNALLFNAKNAPWRAKILLPFWSLFIIIKQAVKILLGINPQVSRAILNGVIDFYKKRFGKIYA